MNKQKDKEMASTKLSPQDKKDLDKYTKFLALKFTQVIVQSRLGDKLSTACKPKTSGTDWFSLAIHDLQDVQAEAKRCCFCPETGRLRLPLCVDISLRTADGEPLALEAWSLSAAPEQPEPEARVTCAVYNRMGQLLKALVSVTRATPAYRLSRNQCPRSYVIYYRLYSGEPRTAGLGDGFKTLRVGQMRTPAGSLTASVAYRTQMTISPAQAPSASLMLDSHHFREPPRRAVDLDRPMRAGAFVDESRARRYTEEDFLLPEEPPFSWLLQAPAPSPEPPAMPPPDAPCEPPAPAPAALPWVEDDQFMEELHFPFAIADKCPTAKLAGFYRQCYNAPPLQTFSSSPPEPAGSVEDITQQLELFEASLQEYDEMITSLCHSPNNN